MLAKKLSDRLPTSLVNSPWLIIIIFSILGLIGILNHAMWRDELNPWLIVRDSQSFTDLIGNIRYEGHPILWYFSLAFLRRIIDNPVIMQLFHLAIAIASVAMFCLYSPFSHKQKFVFAFGFLPFYEYLVISRNYAFSLLFLFSFCTIFSSRKKNYVYLSLLLGLLANSNLYALFIATCLLTTLAVEFIFDSEHRQQYFSQSQKFDLLLSILIIVFSFFLAIYIMTPPIDSYLNGGLSDGWSIKLDLHHLFRSLGRVFGGYLLIVPSHKRWLDLIICALIAIFIITLTAIKLCKKPLILFFYILGTSLIFAFTYLRFTGVSRHFGHFYLVLIVALWLEKYYQDSPFLIDRLSIQNHLLKFAQRWYPLVFMVILYTHLVGGITNFTKDLFIPFSAGRETSHYLQKSHLENEFIVASRDANMASLSGYLKRQFYYPEVQRMGSYTIFRKGRQRVTQAEILRQISFLLKTQEEPNKILLILNKELKFNRSDLNINPIKNFKKAWVDSERYYLYWVNKEVGR
ncbi:hypothetical protein [Nostoc sp. TCL26-01]|uniref:hypothetical protein n=1 Tax=Nostoc sp. TCL26-01 TaxID=2576904 RepID=UPI0015BC0B71|nr:hypothetical protein [Nostoc sp. TCL26-01]QLE54938.1 hypothetical protein FD725_05045 [Nostoc sp. TCL26-01]